jgi:hypothetical protein
MEELWDAIKNTFLNALKGSFKRTNIVVIDTGDKLEARKTETGIGELNTYFAPFKTSYTTLYLDWKQTNNTYHALTATVQRYKSDLSGSKIDRWETIIKPAFLDDPEGYKNLFPKGRSLFQEGGYEERIAAVKVLGSAIDSRAALASVKTDISDFGRQFEAARSLQQGKEGLAKKLSVDMELERVKACEALYWVQGRLMALFNKTPKAIEAFYDLEVLRRTGHEEDEPEESLVLTLAPGQTVEAGIPLTDDKKYLFSNLGEVPLTIWAGGDKPDVPENPFILRPGEEVEKLVTELGAPGSRYLYILNDNPDFSGAVEIIEVTGEL